MVLSKQNYFFNLFQTQQHILSNHFENINRNSDKSINFMFFFIIHYFTYYYYFHI